MEDPKPPSPRLAAPISEIQYEVKESLTYFGNAIGFLTQKAEALEFGAPLQESQEELVDAYIGDINRSFSRMFELIDDLPDLDDITDLQAVVQHNNATFDASIQQLWPVDMDTGIRTLSLDNDLAALEEAKRHFHTSNA